MAFHPLRYFQKHQKTFLAGVTILAMLTFILSFGAGDVTDWIRRAFGGEGRYGHVATLYGKTIDQRDLAHVQERRYLANAYMQQAVNEAAMKVEKKVRTALPKWDAFQQR